MQVVILKNGVVSGPLFGQSIVDAKYMEDVRGVHLSRKIGAQPRGIIYRLSQNLWLIINRIDPRKNWTHRIIRMENFKKLFNKLYELIFSVPVRIKIAGIIMLPVLILGFTLNYWITTGFSDWLSYILTDQRVQAAMQAGSRSVVLVTILAALASTFFAFILTYLLTRPLLDLHETAQQVSSGKLESRAKVWAKDEIGEVARSVNAMIDELVTSQEELSNCSLPFIFYNICRYR